MGGGAGTRAGCAGAGRRGRAPLRGLPGRILGAGAGPGRNSPFAPAGARVTAVDASPAMLARAAKRADKQGRAVEFQVLD
ncbi:class I SAM-dependent methyltransferase, partial [Azospirillum brasilense]|uniref:class I SAM-dependent methyltransferase n=1 Tax=Azospirillum brasilense TaxID=192 RepID=UPI00157B3C3A